jgi:hypothetical protein
MKNNSKLGVGISIATVVTVGLINGAQACPDSAVEIANSNKILVSALTEAGLYNQENAEIYVKSLKAEEMKALLGALRNQNIGQSQSVHAFSE